MASHPPPTLFTGRQQPLPPGAGTIGMMLFLVALFMLFAGSILGYLLIRFKLNNAPPLGSINLPWGLWLSTLLLILSSFTIHAALRNVRYERQPRFRRAMNATLVLALGFLLVQGPSLAWLLDEHVPRMQAYWEAVEEARAAAAPFGTVPVIGAIAPLEGLIFVLILIHALHLLGGLIPLAVTTYRAHQDRYDHEHYQPIRHLAMYWHFLDGVWIVMFGVFLAAS